MLPKAKTSDSKQNAIEKRKLLNSMEFVEDVQSKKNSNAEEEMEETKDQLQRNFGQQLYVAHKSMK